MDRIHRGRRATVPTVAALLFGLAACAGNEPIPSGAQRVNIYHDRGTLLLEPGGVHPGDVYLVLDEGSISFVEHKEGPYGSPGPLESGQLTQIGQGNLQDTSISGLDAGTCDADQRASAREMTGPCGNVMLVHVQPGVYLIVDGAPEEPGQLSVPLSVTP